MEVPNQPTNILNIINPATPNRRFRYCCDSWLKVLLRIIKNVAVKKVAINEEKYIISLKSINPLLMLSKCVIGLNNCKRLAIFGGKVIATISRPIIINIIPKVKPKIKDII